MNGKKIFIAVSNTSIASQLTAALEELEYTIIGRAETVQDFISTTTLEEIDLLILDVDFCGPSQGVALAQDLHDHLDLPIVYVTNRSDEELRSQAENSHSFGFILTPIRKRELELVIHLTLYKSQQEREMIQTNSNLEREVAKRTEDLVRSELHYRTLITSLPDPVFLLDKGSTNIVDCNPAAEALYRRSKEQMLGSSFQDLQVDHSVDWGRFLAAGGDRIPLFHISADGTIFPVSLTRTVTQIGDTELYVIVVRDITEQRDAEKRLQRMVVQDSLTGLPNRVIMEDRISGAIERLRMNPDAGYAVICVGLDNFSSINTMYGHRAGDYFLKRIGLGFVSQVKPSDSVGRFEGDQYLILLENRSSHSEVVSAVNRLLLSSESVCSFQGKEIRVGLSIGVYLGEKSINSDVAIDNAHIAMLRAKQDGKSCFRIFEPTMVSNTRRKTILGMELEQAIHDSQIFLEYQPIHTIGSGELQGFEALLRWFHPQRGLISPSEFIPIAEETGKIVPLGQWVFKQACLAGARWVAEGMMSPTQTLSINISGKQFYHDGLVSWIDEALAESGFSPGQIKIEITETEAMHNAMHTVDILHQLRQRGIRISIDDFGTGFSSLSYLQQFPVDTLKIDLSFIRRLEKNFTNIKITETIINLSHTLGLDVIAEGVETLRQLDILKGLGCDFRQGWLWSHALKPKDVEIYLQQDAEITQASASDRDA